MLTTCFHLKTKEFVLARLKCVQEHTSLTKSFVSWDTLKTSLKTSLLSLSKAVDYFTFTLANFSVFLRVYLHTKRAINSMLSVASNMLKETKELVC